MPYLFLSIEGGPAGKSATTSGSGAVHGANGSTSGEGTSRVSSCDGDVVGDRSSVSAPSAGGGAVIPSGCASWGLPCTSPRLKRESDVLVAALARLTASRASVELHDGLATLVGQKKFPLVAHPAFVRYAGRESVFGTYPPVGDVFEVWVFVRVRVF